MKPRILVVANQKGGVGKTTTAINLGTALAAIGEPTLIVDIDPQGNASTGLGIAHTERERNIYHVLMGQIPLAEAIAATRIPKLSILPANVDLSGAELELIDMDRRNFRLKDALNAWSDEKDVGYSYVLIDCPPSLSLLTVNAMVASDAVIVPLQCEFFALEGLSQLMKTIGLVRESLNPNLVIQGIVLTMYDRRNKLSLQVEADVRETLGDKVYNTLIPRNVRISEAPSHGLPALVYDLNCPGSQAYIKLAGELIQRERGIMSSDSKKNTAGKNTVSETHPRGLGRGLSALIGDTGGMAVPKTGGVRTLPVAFLSANLQQPRKRFSADDLNGLADSIRENGILQPILVRPISGKADAYEIVAGERRWRAAQIAKLHDVPVVVRQLSDRETLEIAIIENVQRADLNAIEEAAAYRELMERFHYTQDQVATQVGKSRSHVANSVRLLNLPDSVRELVEVGKLSAGHARTLIGHPDAEARALEIIAQSLNVREAEKKSTPKKAHSPVRDPNLVAEEDRISNGLGLKVQIIHNGDKGGEIRIFYRDLEQFDAVTAKLKR